MANQRIFLWAALALILWLNYQAWMHDYHPQAPPTVEAPAGNAPSQTPTTSAPDNKSAVPAPFVPDGATAPNAATPSAAGQPVAGPESGTAPSVHVVTDVLDMDISLTGGDLVRADLLHYPREKNQPDLVRLLEPDGVERTSVVHSGLSSGSGAAQPDQLARFEAAAREYRLAEGQ